MQPVNPQWKNDEPALLPECYYLLSKKKKKS